MKKYPEEIRAYIAANVKGATTKALAALVNAEFGTDFTESKMMSYKTNHKLRSGTPGGVPAGSPTKLYPEEVKRFIAEHYIGTGHQTMADLLNQTFGTSYTRAQMSSYYKNFKLDSGLKGHFKKGCIPFNKGLKAWWTGGEETRFKRGWMPWNYKPIGAERINSDGYVDIKVQDGTKQKNWRGKHSLVWEAHHGRPIPKGHVVIFADGNRRNFDPDNLLLVSRAQLARMNQTHLIKNDAELTKTGVIVADVLSKIGERKRKGKRSDAIRPEPEVIAVAAKHGFRFHISPAEH